MRLLLAGMLFVAASGAALAQPLACNPTAPRLDPGVGFVPFGPDEQLLARGGNSGRAWEWALGTNTDGHRKVKGNLDWISGRTYTWTLSYSGAGSATLKVHHKNALKLSLAYPSGMDAGNALQLEVATKRRVGLDTTLTATLTSINGAPVSGTISETGDKRKSAESLFFYYPPMAQGFTAKGTVTLSYEKRPKGQRVQFRVRAGTLPCDSQPPTVAIIAPAANQLFHAPASIAVSADAADVDGSVASVEFFANGNPIGSDTSSPYSIEWSNVPAGAHSLTAVATDNTGQRTTSAAVPVLVNAPPAVTLAAPTGGAVFTAPASITLTAEASDGDGSVANVEFYEGATLITTLSAPPYSFIWTGVQAGTYSLTARATDDRGAIVASMPLSITVNPGAPKLHFIHVDHLNTPRLVADTTGTTLWRWAHGEPFGLTAPTENTSGLGAFMFPIRFPGQYFDLERNAAYNYARDYDATTGRYLQSDPLGLQAGLNTYAYVESAPISLTDPRGLEVIVCIKPLHALGEFDVGTRKSYDGYIPNALNPLYHEFLCTGQDRDYRCGGKDYTPSILPPVGRGKPSKDYYPFNRPDLCEKVDDSKCVERCAIREVDMPTRSYYLLIGASCQSYVRRVLKKCRKECDSSALGGGDSW